MLQFNSLKPIMHNLTVTQQIHRKHLGEYGAVYPLTIAQWSNNPKSNLNPNPKSYFKCCILNPTLHFRRGGTLSYLTQCSFE